jgi:class 3 adenylate cyclase/tetratricopeptide (TPR) repeat protein
LDERAGVVTAASRAAVPLHPYVSELAARALAESPTGGCLEIDGTLAFFDISGFTTITERLAGLGRRGAEHINDILNLVFHRLIDEVFHFGGDVLEFGGDAMVVLYSGADHQRRAAQAAARMFKAIGDVGRLTTPAGKVRLGMSCGMASGSQPYYLLGSSRKALVVAGPVSTAMARLEASADRGQALVCEELAASLPRAWVQRREGDGAWRLRFNGFRGEESVPPSPRERPAGLDTSPLLPVEFRSLVDVGRRDGELKQVAMAFIRLDETDALLTAGGPEAVRARLAEVTDVVDQTAAANGVCWLETQAEANSVRWTLIAGAPTATEHDGERLLRVVREIADRSPSPLRIGSNLGVVFVGDMGHPQRCTYIVMGDTTNLAARLMVRARPGEIIAGERLHESCPGTFEVTALDPMTVKGKKQPVQAYVIGALAATPAAVDTTDKGDIIGRADETRELLAAIAAGGVVELVGEAGIGKTRLWHEAWSLTAATRRWVVVRAEPHEANAPYAPFARLLREAASIDVGGSDDTAGRALTRLVTEVAPEQVPWLPLVADVAGVTVAATPEVDRLDDAFRAERLRLAVGEVVVAVAGSGAVIVVEDSHWLDDASRALVATLGRLLGPSGCLLLTRRPDGLPHPDATVLEIGPIAGASADALVLRELPDRLASDGALTRLRTAAGGNPLFLIELARAASAGMARSGEELPASVERLIAARIDRLPVAGRQLIRDAAVLGSTFPRALGARVLEREDLTKESTWARELGDLVSLDGDDVRFSHDMVRKAAYEGLSVRRRQVVHRRACAVIEDWGDSVPLADPISTLAFHATGAGSPELIVKWNRLAAEAAVARGAMEVAEEMLTAVVPAQLATDAPPAERFAVHRSLATAAERAGHLEVSLEALDAARTLSAGDERAGIAVDRARVLEKLGRYRSSLLVTARALKARPDWSVACDLLLARASVRSWLGDWKGCLRIATDLLADDSCLEPRLRAQAHLLAELCCSCLDLPERADHEEAAMKLMTELDDALGLGNILLNRGVSAWRECRVRDAVADFRASSECYERAGDVVGEAMADNNLAEILTLQVRLDPAEDLLRNALRVTRAANYPHGEMTALSGLSRLAAWRGDTADALDLQSTALSGFRGLAADDYVLDSLVRLVEIHALAGDAEAALAAADQAHELLARLGTVPVVPSTLARLRARALIDAGRESEAESSLERALALAKDDGFEYEIALSSLMLGRLHEDDQRINTAMEQLQDLDVLDVPPVC